jgi:hypothetical protein
MKQGPGQINRRTFLSAVSAIATQQRIGPFTSRRYMSEDEPEPVQAISLSRFPYMQNVRADRASILWATLESGVGEVTYTSDGVTFHAVPAITRYFSRFETGMEIDYVQYRADLIGLEPDTEYSYAVAVNGQQIGAPGEMRFRTAGTGPFTFVVFGDSGWGNPEDPGQSRIAQRIAAEKPALIVHTGDLVYPRGSFESYQRNYFNYYAGIMASVPFFPCPGNHDYDVLEPIPYLAIHALPTDGVPEPDAGRYYSFDWGNVHFVSIDAIRALQEAITNDGPMLRWLENDLQRTRQFWRIVYFHYPAYSTGSNVNDTESAWIRQFVVPILEKHGVQLVFSGHEHSYQRSVPFRNSCPAPPGIGTSYFVSGGGGAILYDAPLTPWVAAACSEYHYLRVEVEGTRIGIRSIRHDGTELDNYTIEPGPVFSDDPVDLPVTLDPGPIAGAAIRIIGRGLAAQEILAYEPSPQTEIAGTVVTVNGKPIHLLYVSPTQICAQLPFDVDGNIVLRVTTPNGFIETSL